MRVASKGALNDEHTIICGWALERGTWGLGGSKFLTFQHMFLLLTLAPLLLPAHLEFTLPFSLLIGTLLRLVLLLVLNKKKFNSR